MCSTPRRRPPARPARARDHRDGPHPRRAGGRATLEALRELGVHLALDDFGTGYSSLSYMRSLPLDSLKIAKEFLDGLAHSEEDRAFVRLIIELARLRGLRIVAEGIEDGEQLEILRRLGCDLAQGYLFARPLDADDADLRAAIGARAAGVLIPVGS